jgi:hypothetical protein
MLDTAWAPVVVAFIAGVSTLGVQVWIRRGEPAAIKRIKLLSEAIDGIPPGDEGQSKLIEARTVLALRLGTSLIGIQGPAKYVRRAAWWCFGIGGILFSAWVAYAIWVPASLNDEGSARVLSVATVLLVVSPALLVTSIVGPPMEIAIDKAAELIQRRLELRRESRDSEAARTPADRETGA